MFPAEDQLQDPDFNRVERCRECSGDMGGLRVHQGSTAENAHKRGSICQSCKRCNWTTCYAGPYNVADAEQLIIRLEARRLNRPVPAAAQMAPLRPRSPRPLPVRAPDGTLLCAVATCVTKSGSRTRGSQTCLELKCKRCCIEAADNARHGGTVRDECRTHRQDAIRVLDPVAPLVPIVQNAQPPRPANLLDALNIPAPAAHVPAPAVHVPAPATHIPANSRRPPDGSQRPSNGSQPLPNSSQRTAPRTLARPQPVTAEASQRRAPLAQPLHPDWLEPYNDAQARRDSTVTLKAKRQEIDELEKRMVNLVVYHEHGLEPFVLEHPCDTFPTLRLRTVAALIDIFTLEDTSLVDVWEGEWKTKVLSTAILRFLERGQRAVLRLRRDLKQRPPNDEDCPGIKDQLKLLAARPLALGKRAAQVLVSPPKAPRRDTTSTAPQSAARNDTRIIEIDDTPPPSPRPASKAAGKARAIAPLPRRPQTPFPDLTQATRLASTASFPAEKRRRWPSDYSCGEIIAGLDTIVTRCLADPKLLLRDVFEKVFTHSDWTRTTFYEHRRNWKNTPDDIKQHYTRASSTPWTFFAAAYSNWAKKNSEFALPAARPTDNLDEDFDDEDLPDIQDAFTRSSETRSSGKGRASESDDLDDDTTKLCPFCDELLPDTLSDDLTKMRANLLASPRTWLDPNIHNSGHYAVDNYVVHHDFCQRHDMERDDLPTARLEEWPFDPDFTALFNRICTLEEVLIAVLHRPNESLYFKACKARYAPGPSRADRLDGTFRSFTGNSAGYYGIEGYQIVWLTLTYLFPDGGFDLTPFKPVPWATLIREFLLPETLLLLIQGDLPVDPTKAANILVKSSKFGRVLHPGADSDSVQAVQRLIADTVARNLAAFDEYEASGSQAGFNLWFKEREGGADGVKEETDELEAERQLVRTETRFTETVIDGKLILEIDD
ncbi:hypothetical protein PLICRDRAFT_122581 [Plicaturopsis crispa FD-325 SS-3]|nr:hypothetical protein PLICRDRAFT_122581 [Plicaturopsis crispa FD-325 SS-3]